MKTPPPGFQNPVLDADFPDPSLLLAPDGYYYAYATNTKREGRIINIQVARSLDLVSWEYLGECLPDKPHLGRPDPALLGPDASRHADGRYLLYYSAQPNDPAAGMVVGVAVADAPAGPFRDSGQPVLAGGQGFQDIDPMRFVDEQTGEHLLYYGSGFGPLRVRELTADGLSFAPGSNERQLVQAAGGSYEQLIEGSWVHRRGDWYYLFYSGNNCCFPHPHYAVLVARSRAALGPYETLAEAHPRRGHHPGRKRPLAGSRPQLCRHGRERAGLAALPRHRPAAAHLRRHQRRAGQRPPAHATLQSDLLGRRLASVEW